MSNSINTNLGAQVALQTLNATNSSLAATQNRISTGLKISSAKDNGAVWGIAQAEKSQVAALDAVTNSLNNGKSVIDVTLSAGTQITDLLNQMKTAAVAASDSSIDSTTRTQYFNQYKALATSVTNAANSAVFNGKSLINDAAAATHGNVSAIGNSDGTITIGSTGTDLTAAGLSLDTATAWSAASDASSASTAIDTALASVTGAMSQFGVDSKSMDNQLALTANIQDSLKGGIGNLIDADVATESANLTALQTKQQLGIQALSIANSSTSTLLSLFR